MTMVHFVIAIAWVAGLVCFGAENPSLRVGEGVTDITPPLGTELAGFHKPPGKERRSVAVRQPAGARALVFSTGTGEYSAMVVPKIMSLPCYKPEVGRALTAQGLELLRKLK